MSCWVCLVEAVRLLPSQCLPVVLPSSCVYVFLPVSLSKMLPDRLVSPVVNIRYIQYSQRWSCCSPCRKLFKFALLVLQEKPLCHSPVTSSSLTSLTPAPPPALHNRKPPPPTGSPTHLHTKLNNCPVVSVCISSLQKTARCVVLESIEKLAGAQV